MTADHVSRYYEVMNEIRERAPTAWLEVIELCKGVPKSIDVDLFWKHGRDKPCWSNIKVKLGARIASDLNLSKDFDDFNRIASDDWHIVMRDEGPRWRVNKNFEVVGATTREYLSSLSDGGLKSYKWKLYAIRQYALSLCNEDGVLPMVRSVVEDPKTLTSDNIYKWTQRFAKKAGRGWGAITVNHLLADLGLSVKPDRHVRRSAVRMGLLKGVPSDLPDEEIDRRAGTLDPLVVPAVIELAMKVTPTALTSSTSAIREVDKVLMEWNRLGFAQPFSSE